MGLFECSGHDLLIARVLAFGCRGHQKWPLENLSVRQQLHPLRPMTDSPST